MRAALGLSAAACLLAATAGVALGAASKAVVIADTREDVGGPLDFQRVSLSRASDGRLRAVMTFVDAVKPEALLAGTGPPGSACLRVWTAPEADPAAMRPDRLVCVTARSQTALRAGVFEQKDTGLPVRTGSASVRMNKSARSLVVRVAQSALGRPAVIRFAVESTVPGCERVTCIDAAPNAGKTRRFRLR